MIKYLNEQEYGIDEMCSETNHNTDITRYMSVPSSVQDDKLSIYKAAQLASNEPSRQLSSEANPGQLPVYLVPVTVNLSHLKGSMLTVVKNALEKRQRKNIGRNLHDNTSISSYSEPVNRLKIVI